MPFYALGTISLLNKLHQLVRHIKQVWLADDATGCGKLIDLVEWWKLICEEGRKIGYIVNESKSWLILKDPQLLDEAMRLFASSNINITTEGKRHLAAALGNSSFCDEHIQLKLNDWCSEMEKLCEFAKSQPHAAFSAYIHGLQHKFTYYLRTLPNIGKHLKPLDDIINEKLIPTFLGSSASPAERDLFSLPIRLGHMGLWKLEEIAQSEYDTSKAATAPLVAILLMQENNLPDPDECSKIRLEINAAKNAELDRKSAITESKLPELTLRSVNQAKEKGASSWLSILPLKDQGFSLHKGEFRDALSIRYNRKIKGLPSNCPCGQVFNLTHALNCKKSGFVIIRHDEIRNFNASLLKIVCNDVQVESHLQPLNGEQVSSGSVTGDEAHLVIKARVFWRSGQSAFFDIRVTNTNADSARALSSSHIYRRHEQEKKRKYNDRVMNIEQGTFTPLVYSTSGGLGNECHTFYRQLANKIATKTNDKYEKVLTWIRCRLSFIVVKVALLCLRGSRTVSKKAIDVVEDFTLACSEAGI